MLLLATDGELEYLYYEQYGSWLMAHADRPIANGDQLIELMEELYMWEEFLESQGLRDA
jgi:hypothetical protein